MAVAVVEIFPHVFSVERPCGAEEWTCASSSGKAGHQCIPMAWVCDEHEDCDDASDEQVCSEKEDIF